ncbi:MAG TPA: hypothetical protein VM534_00455, partial [Thermoanaerobaculia bacterium]|nr:hypothetical protein [Thermoanaerobaculia bacterium]
LIPLGIAWVMTGNPLRVHALGDLGFQDGWKYARGLFGILLDAQTGLLFQAPLWFAALLSLIRWKDLPPALRMGALGSLIYLFYLLPRVQWHGGWSPPLRYLVVFAPLVALAAGSLVERMRPIWLGIIALVTTGLAMHGVARPYRLFHIENGESTLGELLSERYGADFSRLLPSFIRINEAAFWWSGALVLLIAIAFLAKNRGWRLSFPPVLVPVSLALLISIGAVVARQPGSLVQFEDSHLTHRGGSLHPPLYTMMRFLHHGGWVLSPGHSVSFLYQGGGSELWYGAQVPVRLRIGDQEIVLPETGGSLAGAEVDLPPRPGRWTVEVLEGTVKLDRMERR